MSSIEDEEKVCGAVTRYMEQFVGETITVNSRPEHDYRGEKAVELLLDSTSGGYALGHTRIEIFPQMIRQSRNLEDVREVFTADLCPLLPPDGHYKLNLPPEAICGNAKAKTEFLAQLKAWVVTKASTLEMGSPETTPRHIVREVLPGLPYEVELQCWRRLSPGHPNLHVMLWEPTDIPSLTRDRIRTALKTKCPKLQVWKTRAGERCRSILVLEHGDLQYASPINVVREEVQALIDDVPDFVFLVCTALESQWEIWTVKEAIHYPQWEPYYFDAGSAPKRAVAESKES